MKTKMVLFFLCCVLVLNTLLCGCAQNGQADSSGDPKGLGDVSYSDPYTEGLNFSVLTDEEGYAVWQYAGPSKDVVIPKIYKGFYVVSIMRGAFYDMSKLETVSIPDSVKYIDSEAFDGCTGLTSITIPNSVTSIGFCAFRNCTGLTSFTIPHSVTAIGNNVFEGCTGLTSICFDGTKQEWEAIEKPTDFYLGESITKVVCTDGEIKIK